MRSEIRLEFLLRHVRGVIARARQLGANFEERLVMLQAIPGTDHDVEVLQCRILAISGLSGQLRPPRRILRRHLCHVDVVHNARGIDELAEHLLFPRRQIAIIKIEQRGCELRDTRRDGGGANGINQQRYRVRIRYRWRRRYRHCLYHLAPGASASAQQNRNSYKACFHNSSRVLAERSNRKTIAHNPRPD
jgi:hypothetical protein